MKVFQEIYLQDFGFCGNAVENAQKLTEKEMEIIEADIEEIYPNGISETLLNDIFAFYFEEDILPILGYETIEEFLEGRS